MPFHTNEHHYESKCTTITRKVYSLSYEVGRLADSFASAAAFQSWRIFRSKKDRYASGGDAPAGIRKPC